MGCPLTLVELYSRDLAEVETFRAGQSCEDGMRPLNSGVLCEFDTSAVALSKKTRGTTDKPSIAGVRSPTGVPTFGTSSVQLSERKSGALLPKRHQTKHLEFVLS